MQDSQCQIPALACSIIPDEVRVWREREEEKERYLIRDDGVLVVGDRQLRDLGHGAERARELLQQRVPVQLRAPDLVTTTSERESERARGRGRGR